ncbi:asparaginase [Marmoricola endophyticus]|uniref:Asparaginase n=1 Tax=Marmoricola endophyticus TaxID=2040280 RepID=A0A917F7M7_9ACTN|nr:asparaginase [Marmoricola endophyticus]GGF51512.1 asparaginase [Marmoricola endophyticus]
MASVVLAEIVRSGFVEGAHHGSAVSLAADGTLAYAAGDVSTPMLPRSCAKPLQAVAMLRMGLELDGELLALASGSHSGEGFHAEGALRILRGAGLDASALQDPPDLPLQPQVRDMALRGGVEPSRLLMNCSGKHAAMLATCAVRGWDTSSYLDPQHPLQQGIEETVAELTGEPIAVHATDGCGAPLLSTSLAGLARAFARLATAVDGPERRVADAIRQHPEWTSGTTRDERALLAAVPGAIAKMGAESCYVVALADGRAFALKHDDGADRVRPVTMTALLSRSGVDTEPGVDTGAVRRLGELSLLGGGVVVGAIRAALP